MFKDVKRGFSFSLGKFLFRVGVFFIILTFIMMISSCKAHAEELNITDFYDNRNEFYNKTLWQNVSGIDYFRVTNTGQLTAIFNNGGNVSNNNSYYRYNVTNLYTSINVGNNLLNTNSELKFRVFFSGVYMAPNETFVSTIDAYDSSTWPGAMSNYNIPPVYVNYIGSSNGSLTANCGLMQLTPNAVGLDCVASIPAGFNIQWLVIDFPINIYSSLLHPLDVIYGIGYGVSTKVILTRDIDLSSAISNQTNQIINNQNNNTQQIVTKIDTTHGILRTISSAITSVINALSNIPSLVFNAFSSILTNILNAFGTLWTNINAAFTNLFDWLSDIFDSIQDILSDDEPTSQYLEDFIDEFIGSHDNIILEFITLPIQFLTAVINSDTCASISLGTLFGTELVLPCLGSKIASILGSSLYTFISVILTAMIYWRMSYFLYDVIEKVITLSLDVNEKFNIDL